MPSPPVAAAGRPTRDAAEQLLARIHEAARVEFLARGIEGASMEGIATAAGCSKLTLYRRFGTKQELFKALIKARSPDYGQRFHVDVTQHPEQVLYRLGLGIAAFFFKPDNLKLIRLVVAEMSRVEGLAEMMKEEGDRFREPVRACLEELKRRGHGKFDDPTLAAIQFINLCVLGHFYLIAGYTADQVSPEQQEKLVRAAVTLFVATHFPEAGSTS
ncbi:TetR/AcrR family transcriptional regulator [Pseudoduganella umbonata]|uniref:AcrR family transcriptional regulator n=1 Tax=Pseudoduganella umbonata TaxID=864828 RepID=A0A4P8I0J7_9BURK|nr:TetR/AcrR family transcriptional regulator [Pseudoduganella umbonata]MBB3221907.1 AcrR family transcriptional regulator [Pseudoduganella umbonata]QCP14294.1 TetR/AcrR family transcriptional regulator [Pseudoduganella umbonata]